MKKTQFLNIVKKLDDQKFDTYRNEGIAFCLLYREPGCRPDMVGIGDGSDMSVFALVQLCELYKNAKEGTTPEEYAESVKKGIILALESGVNGKMMA